MSAHSQGSGPRSNSYSENRFTNWAEYEPWWLEIQAIYKRFDNKIAKRPVFPKIIELPPLDGFVKPCTAREIETQLSRCPGEFVKGLRAIFILSGTKKQLKSWGQATTFSGHYWMNCIFLHPYPHGRENLNWARRYYLRDVLMHEIGHHVDTWNETHELREKFAEDFARKHG